LLDEPFSALDLHTRLDIPMLLITHDPADVAAFGDQVVQMHDGSVRQDAPFKGYVRTTS